MDKLLKEKLFSLLSESSQVTNDEMRNAYGCFTEQVESISQAETDFSEIFRLLIHSRIEFKVFQTQILHGQEKKCA